MQVQLLKGVGDERKKRNGGKNRCETGYRDNSAANRLAQREATRWFTGEVM